MTTRSARTPVNIKRTVAYLKRLGHEVTVEVDDREQPVRVWAVVRDPGGSERLVSATTVAEAGKALKPLKPYERAAGWYVAPDGQKRIRLS